MTKAMRIAFLIGTAAVFGGCAGANTRANMNRALLCSSTNDEIYAADMGNPDSVDYGNREISNHSPTNDEIDAAEMGNPDSVDYGNREISSHSPTNDEWQALGAENPHNPQPGNARRAQARNRVVVCPTSPDASRGG
jgi:hypothetical protein